MLFRSEKIRTIASSGGILTEIAHYLLKEHKVNCVIQIRANKSNPLETEVVWNTEAEEVLESSGSRYTASAALINLLEKLDFSKRYAIIAKPCDIRVLREYLKQHKEYNETIRSAHVWLPRPHKPLLLSASWMPDGCLRGDRCMSIRRWHTGG